MMFTAIVYVCLSATDPAPGMSAVSQCYTLEDARGPYEVREDCDRRVKQMMEDAADEFSALDDGAVRGWCDGPGIAPLSRRARHG